MEITEVRVFFKDAKDKKLKAYAAVTFDDVFVVRNIKVIEGSKGLFVAMPSRKLREVCPRCSYTNVVKAKFCNECGTALNSNRTRPVELTQIEGDRQSDHRDIAHPVTSEFRDYLQKKILFTYESEKTKTGNFARVV